jgi:hypothetical protein
MPAKRLSGWTRLWLVFAVVVWLAGAVATLFEHGVPPPGANASDADACAYVWRSDGYPSYMVLDGWLGRCEATPTIAAGAHQRAADETPGYWARVGVSLLGWAILPLLVAGVWAIGRWVQRGFKPEA